MAANLRTTARKIIQDLKQKYPSLSPDLLNQLVRTLESEKRFQTEFTKFFQDIDLSDLEAKVKLQKWIHEHAPTHLASVGEVDLSKAPVGDTRLAVIADEFHPEDFQHADFMARFKEHHAVLNRLFNALKIENVEQFREALRAGYEAQHQDPAILPVVQQEQTHLYKVMTQIVHPAHVTRFIQSDHLAQGATPTHEMQHRMNTQLFDQLFRAIYAPRLTEGQYHIAAIFNNIECILERSNHLPREFDNRLSF